MKYRKTLLVIAILFLFTRLYSIESIPPSVYWDEASIGYNAYSLITTGKDEWGDFLPIHFRAFGEFKLPVYIYTVSFFETIFGLNNFSVRAPAVLFSLGTLVLTYLLGRKITGKETIGLFAAFFIAITPWFFLLSRTGYELSAGLMFYLLGIYLFLFAREKNVYLILSTFSFVFSIYSYNSFRILVPLTFLMFCAFFLGKVKRISVLVPLLLSILIFVMVSIPIIRLNLSDSGAARLNQVSIVSPGDSPSQITGKLLKSYFQNFSPEFLFIYGDKNLRSGQVGYGELGWLSLPLIILGLIYVLKSKNYLLYGVILLIIISPIPAAITKESPHALRSMSMLPFISIIASCGVFFLSQKLKIKIVYSVTVLLFLSFFAFYFYTFLTDYSAKSSVLWQFGYKEIFTNFKDEFGKYDHILVSDYLAQPYIFSLYYLKVDPNSYLENVEYNSVDKWGFSKVKSYNNFIFSRDVKNIPSGRTLVFASPKEKLNDIIEREVIKNLDGSIAFYVYEYQKD